MRGSRQIRAERAFEQEALAVDIDRRLPSSTVTRRRERASKAAAAGADTFDQGALSTRSTATLLAIICFCTLAIDPMTSWSTSILALCRTVCRPLCRGRASLQMMESSDFLCLTSSSSKRSGVPTPMNPPIITVARLGILATASSTRWFSLKTPKSLAFAGRNEGCSGAA